MFPPLPADHFSSCDGISSRALRRVPVQAQVAAARFAQQEPAVAPPLVGMVLVESLPLAAAAAELRRPARDLIHRDDGMGSTSVGVQRAGYGGVYDLIARVGQGGRHDTSLAIRPRPEQRRRVLRVTQPAGGDHGQVSPVGRGGADDAREAIAVSSKSPASPCMKYPQAVGLFRPTTSPSSGSRLQGPRRSSQQSRASIHRRS
jgi:hypothetical protein